MTPDLLLNALVFLCTAVCYVLNFRKDGVWSWKNGLYVLRYFTLLSNLFCACACLAAVFCLSSGTFPRWVWIARYVGTASVTVTLLTVMVFLGPALGYKSHLSGFGFYYHLAGPLLAIVSFCFLERVYVLSFALSLLGMVPVLLYGLVYLYKVVLGPQEKRWEDFYGYNKSGRWPVSFTAMLIGAFLICLLLRFLYSL